ncbi:endonuclease [Escherichia phage vB_Eco_mar003J3]|uniref:Putative Hef-like homing endonuclease n=1 Tax=Escherichia phage vB_Eco_mar003J3 TaxID=2419761 RepID=A0A3P4A7P9_9CAUD|nr:endonuclease [Escherichia phage vB_Eco_mar003J3]VCU43767.1 putative Hef-like homing endonuclease [Escherichia phage vB_Eco_mar003J3]
MVRRKLDKDTINKDLEPRRIKLISEYSGILNKGTFICSVGHTWEATVNNVRNSKSGCPICAGTFKLTKDSVNEGLRSRGITLIGEYKNNATKTLFECEHGHRWEATVGNVKNKNSGCPVCDTDWNTPGFIYIMRSSMGTKIGISISPERRWKEIVKSSNILDLYIFGVYSIDSGTKSKSRSIEKQTHEYFSEYRLKYTGFAGCTEFFDISPIAVEKHLINNGCIKVEK